MTRDHASQVLPRRRVLKAAAGALALAAAGSTRAAGWPDRPVHLVVPFSPGGATDVLARILGRSLEGQWARTVVVENRVGAAGAIGAAYVAKAAADGHVALFGGVGTNVVLQYTQPSLPYGPTRDFVPVGNFCYVDFVLTVAASSPYRSLDDIIKAARQQPDKLSYMSAGQLGTLHVAQEYLWKKLAGVRMIHVPYKGESHVVTDLVAGRVDTALMTLSLTRQLAAEGKVRMLATFAPQRLAGAPDLPTVAELGFPGFAMPTWNGLFVPAATPAERVEALNRGINVALADPKVRRQVLDMGISPSQPNTPGEYAAFLQKEDLRWRTMIADSGVLVA